MKYTKLLQRKFVFLCVAMSLFVLNSTVAFSQSNSQNEATQFEKFSSEEGSLVIREYYKHGAISAMGGAIDFNLIRLTRLRDKESVVGLRFEVNTSGGFYASVLDTDEIQSLVDAVAYIKSNQDALMNRGGEKAYVEVEYESRDGLELTMFESSKGGYGLAMKVGGHKVYPDIDKLDEMDRILRSSLESIKQL